MIYGSFLEILHGGFFLWETLHSSRCRERSISREKRPSRSGCSRGRSRGRGRNELLSHSRSRGSSSNNKNTKDGREKHGLFIPQTKLLGQIVKAASDIEDRSCSPAPKWRKTGCDLDRSRGRDRSYSPDDIHRRPG